MARYRSFPRRQVLEAFAKHLRDERRDLVKLGLAIATIAFCFALGPGGYLAGLITGGFLVAGPAVVWISFLTAADGHRLVLASAAETWTRDELRDAVKRDEAWHALDTIELQYGDIDHVLVAPAGVIAVETKYVGSKASARYLPEHVAGTARTARRVKAILGSVRSYPHPVHALLVVWGQGTRHLPDVQEIGGVTVVRGLGLTNALARFGRGPLAQDHAQQLSTLLSAYRAGLPAHQ